MVLGPPLIGSGSRRAGTGAVFHGANGATIVTGPEGGGDPDLAEDTADLHRRLLPKLRAIPRRFGIPPEDTDDVVQQAWLHFVRKRKKIRNPERWLPEAVRNECRMFCRGRDRRRTVAVDEAILELVAGGGGEDPERAVLRRDLGSWLKVLPRNCQSLLRMRYGLELNPQQVATRTGYRPSSVDKVTRRCLDALSRKMASIAVRRRTRR